MPRTILFSSTVIISSLISSTSALKVWMINYTTIYPLKFCLSSFMLSSSFNLSLTHSFFLSCILISLYFSFFIFWSLPFTYRLFSFTFSSLFSSHLSPIKYLSSFLFLHSLLISLFCCCFSTLISISLYIFILSPSYTLLLPVYYFHLTSPICITYGKAWEKYPYE